MNYTYQELRNIASFICREFLNNLELPKISFKSVCRGRARYKTRRRIK